MHTPDPEKERGEGGKTGGELGRGRSESKGDRAEKYYVGVRVKLKSGLTFANCESGKVQRLN